MSNILVTGSTGFVGSHLVSELINCGENVVGLVRDSIPSDWLDYALDGAILVKGDIRDFSLLKRIISHYDVDRVYHIAAAAQVKSAWKNPMETFETNVMGTVNVLEAVRQIDSIDDGIKTVVLTTDKCYGEKIGAVETDSYQASEPYATSKVCQAMAVKTYMKTYCMEDCLKMVHSVNIFGYDPFNSRLVGNVIKDCLKGKNPVAWTNDNSIREYVYIDDAVDALIRVMNDECLSESVYHIYTGWIYNQKDVVMKILENFPELKCEYKDGDIPFQIQNETLSSVNWNWKPSCCDTFEDAIYETIDKFEEYRSDWDNEEFDCKQE